jgi:hypothetical protein
VAAVIFSASFKSRPEKIITSLKVRQAQEVCVFYGLDSIPFEAAAMWDTGANGCCISYALADGRPLASVPVTGFEKWGKFDIIIGMNIINLGDFSWARVNDDRIFTFSI